MPSRQTWVLSCYYRGMQLTIIGTGFVGVVSAAVFSSFGNTVYGLDIDERKIAALKQGKVPFYEPGLEDMLKEQQHLGHLHFTMSYEEAIPDSDVVIIAVGTPSAPDGTADLTYVKKATEALSPYLKAGAIVAVKSTVPPGTLDKLEEILREKTQVPYVLASLPEFLREGSAVDDTLHPDRVVIGCSDEAGKQTLAKLHQPLNAPLIFVSPESAQMGKYAGNAYLATRITFINQMADLCEKNGADVEEVIRVIGADERIGSHYWYPGLGYGGSCFPKDVSELAAYSRTIGYGDNLFNKIHDLNKDRVYQKLDMLSEKIGGWEGKKVALLGLSFKKNTDDMREAPSTKIIPHLKHEGAKIQAYDPMAMELAHQWFPADEQLQYLSSVEEAVQGADVVLAVIEWPEIVNHEFLNGQGRFFVDARNQFNPEKIKSNGWYYVGIGRGQA